MTLRTLNYGNYGIFLIMGISRVISALNGVTLIITLLITYLLSLLPLQVGVL